MSDISLPPTFNTLGPRQRARLLQSSRKLGAILGTTPQFVEIHEPASRSSSLRKESRLYTLPDSSTSSIEFSQPSPAERPSRSSGFTLSLKLVGGPVKAPSKTPKTSSAPLVLHYQIPRGYDPRLSIASTISTESETQAGEPRSPLSPRHSNAMDFRRRRMAKLKATLGENVPPELVFPADAAEERRQLRAQRGRSWSVGSPAAPLIERRTSVKAPVVFERSRVDSLAFRDYTERAVSRAETIDYASRDKSLERSISPDSFLSVESTTHRKEKGWSGEWNKGDMDNVIKSLRDLKSK